VITLVPAITFEHEQKNPYEAEPTLHGGIAPVHRLGWGHRGLLGAMRGGGRGDTRGLLSGRARRGDGPNRFRRHSRGRGGRAVLVRVVVGWGARRTLAARFRGGCHQPFWRHDGLFRRQRFTQSVPQGVWVRNKVAV